jgi:hypothetical protein
MDVALIHNREGYYKSPISKLLPLGAACIGGNDYDILKIKMGADVQD